MTAKQYQIEMCKAASSSASIATTLRHGYRIVAVVEVALAIVSIIIALYVHLAFLVATALILWEAWKDYRKADWIWRQWMMMRQEELDQAMAAERDATDSD